MNGIVAPIFIDSRENGKNNRCLVGADDEPILSTSDCSQHELDEIVQSVNGKKYASLFLQELLCSVESLSGIAEEHGVFTLTDLMYLQNAILDNNYIDHYPETSKVMDIVQTLPSASIWSMFLKEVPTLQVESGLYSGSIINIERGVVTQKIGRDPSNIVKHDFSKLNSEMSSDDILVKGSVVDIVYVDGVGKVIPGNKLER